MGTKIHPKVFRLSTIYRWDSKWFASRKNFVGFLRDDVRIREYLMKELKEASVDSIMIDRNSNKISVTIYSGKPGFIIGRAGAGIEELTKKIQKKFFRGKRIALTVNVSEVAHPSLSARIVGQQIASEIEKRMPFRRSLKMAVERVMKSGAKGVRVMVGGRLNGSEIARREARSEGSIPLHNLRADIDFARVTAHTIWGTIGVKVWIYKGEVFETAEKQVLEKPVRRNVS
ncbi:MAG: 30S ribosomal protein S3 [Patescibacteria group bacterium]|jgi:small subunit ribosomal protein S3